MDPWSLSLKMHIHIYRSIKTILFLLFMVGDMLCKLLCDLILLLCVLELFTCWCIQIYTLYNSCTIFQNQDMPETQVIQLVHSQKTFSVSKILLSQAIVPRHLGAHE